MHMWIDLGFESDHVGEDLDQAGRERLRNLARLREKRAQML